MPEARCELEALSAIERVCEVSIDLAVDLPEQLRTIDQERRASTGTEFFAKATGLERNLSARESPRPAIRIVLVSGDRGEIVYKLAIAGGVGRLKRREDG